MDTQRNRLTTSRQPVDCSTEDVPHIQSREAEVRSNPIFSTPSTRSSQIVLPIMNRESGDVQSKESNGGDNLDFPVPKNTVEEPDSAKCEDEIVQKLTVLSTSYFQGSSKVNINNSNFSEIHGNATIIRFGDGLFTEVQRNLICDYIANLTILPDIQDSLNRTNLAHVIIDLPRAEAVFDDYQTKKKSGPCFEGTRVALLREMADWIIGTDESRMYILSGLAGIGKSTVAYTIASRAADLNLLGASFFFSRDENDRKNAKKFFTTIAYQLCVYDETFAKEIGDVLQTRRGSAAVTKDPQEQLQALIVDPLRSIVQLRARPILVVVDALDECDEDDAFSVLAGLKQLVQVLASFKVILTMRPQPSLDHFISSQDGHKILRLQDIEDKVVDGDIRLYLKYFLSLEQVRKRLPTRKWCASDDEIDCLVRAAGRLFIIASTVVRIILDKSSNPAVQMRKLLGTFALGRMPFKDLNEFYTVILRNVVPVDCDDDAIDRYQSLVGALISVQYPLSVSTLVHLICMDEEDIRAVLANLQSVILLGDDDIPRIYHKSFPDYITDSKLCQDIKLCIDLTTCHTQMTKRCFRIMEQFLKYNILGLGTPARFMSNKDGFIMDGVTDEQLEREIPQQLQYACVYWANHIELASIKDRMKELEQFANEHLLHWLEALSLIRKLDFAHRAIRVVLNILNSTPSDLYQLLYDGLRFISKFYTMIQRSALHIYYSALPLTPTESTLYRQYIEAGYSICSVDGGPRKWNTLVANINHGNFASVIKFSLDSTMLVSSSLRKLKVWDAVTGTPISTISRAKFAIADDFSTVAVFKGRIITLYDINDSEKGPTFTTAADIYRVAISSQGCRIAAISSNGVLCLWNCRNGELIISLDEITLWAKDPFQLSVTGASTARLVHSSAGGSIHLRDANNGDFIACLCISGFLHVEFKFSADGSRIAALSTTDVKLWSCEDGKLIGIAQTIEGMLSNSHRELVVSKNGSYLATTSDSEVKLWSGNRGNPMPLVGVLCHGYLPARSLAISEDDILAITTHEGIIIYDTKSHTFVSTLSFPRPTAVAISPDSTRLAAGGSDGTVYLWDIQNIQAGTSCISSNTRAGGQLTALALSGDCSRIAYGFENGTVELWETVGLTKQAISAHTHHPEEITALGWCPDGSRFASGSGDGIINLWDGAVGALCGTVRYTTTLDWLCPLKVEASNAVLAVAGERGLFLWDIKTLDHIHTFDGSFEPRLSFSADGALIAAVRIFAPIRVLKYRPDSDPPYCDEKAGAHASHRTIIFDVINCTILSAFDIDSCAAAFLPDNSGLVVQHFEDNDKDVGDLLTFNLINEELTRGPTFEYFMKLRNMPLWQDSPVFIKHECQQWYLGPFFRHDCCVPMLWIPPELDIRITTQCRSMVVLSCENGDIIHIRLRNPVG